ncbi:hypothetical protein ACLOJK_024654 [Asimina triloba]
MVTTDELYLALHRLGFKVVVDELKTVVKSHIRLSNSGLIFNDFGTESFQLVKSWKFVEGQAELVDDDHVVAIVVKAAEDVEQR